MNLNRELNQIENAEYLLLTPGPLTTSSEVKNVMLKDWCTWDRAYNDLVQDMRKRVLDIATESQEKFTVIPMQGSGTFSVEATLGTVVGEEETVLIISNGAYGDRMEKICSVGKIPYKILRYKQVENPSSQDIEKVLKENSEITHIAVVHCETTSGILNPIEEIGKLAKKYGKTYIVDAMSSFGGIYFDIDKYNIDFLVTSSNKCIQGVPGFGIIIGRKEELLKIKGKARSHSLDIYDQWSTMEKENGKWRFTSPTHVVRAFYQALLELENEGGVLKREERYRENQRVLVEGMRELGFQAIISREKQSPIITTFYAPKNENYNFKEFYLKLKEQGFVIYPGKLTEEESFRIGNIGEIYSEDMNRLIKTIKKSMFWS